MSYSPVSLVWDILILANKDLIGENLAEHRDFFDLYEHRKIYTVGCMSAINYFIKMGCPYFQKDPGEVLDF